MRLNAINFAINRLFTWGGGNVGPSLIAQLFTPGTVGFCGGMSVTEAYDNGWLFADAAGTTPASLEGPVGLALDQSGGTFNASQSTTTKRTTLSARVNIAVRSNDFEDGAVINGVDITPDTLLGPYPDDDDGVTITEDANDTIHYTRDNFGIAISAGQTIRLCSYFKAGSAGRNAQFGLTYGGTSFGALVNLQTGTISGGSTEAGTVIDASIEVVDGWYECTVIGTMGPSVTLVLPYTAISNLTTYVGTVGPWYQGDGTSYIYAFGRDVRPADSGATLPAYQRVNTATDYDSVGFPKYLIFDGTDDCFVTPSIDLTGTDKVTVFWGGYTASDSSAMLAEFSQNVSATNNNFYLLSGANIVTGYNWNTKMPGGFAAGCATTFTVAAPNSAVVSVASDIAGSSNAIRVNGVAGTPNSVSLGSGNFGNYPLFIGARDQSSFFFTGRMYALPIVVGRAVEPALILKVEAAINASMGTVY